MDRRLRSMDAAVTAWPLFVYDIFDYDRMRKIILDYFKTLSFGEDSRIQSLQNGLVQVCLQLVPFLATCRLRR